MRLNSILLSGFVFCSLYACKSNYHIQTSESKLIAVDSTYSYQKDMMNMIAPYKTSLGKIMGDTIAYCPKNFDVSHDKGLLCLWAGDAIQWYCDSVLHIPNDFCSTNYYGLRIPSIPKGPVLLGTMYELMPFENFLAILTIDSVTMDSFLMHNAQSGYWPYSNKLTLELNSDKTIKSWNIKKHSDGNNFIMVTNDYIAKGGSNHAMLKDKTKKITSYALRDVFIAYAKHQKELHVDIDDRYKIASHGK